jgi:hypothetical protein
MESLNKQGKPRKRAPGAGRPTKHGEATRSIRVPVSISTGQITSLKGNKLRSLKDRVYCYHVIKNG